MKMPEEQRKEEKMNMNQKPSKTIVPLNAAQLDQLAADLDQVRNDALAQVGAEDARYIRRLIAFQRGLEIIARLSLVGTLYHWGFWLFGAVALGISKILDNMEIGHNVLHGQYDFMNDKNINSRNFDWDIVGDSGSWKRVHNYEHHTYTNILGKDRDFGYGLLRLSSDYAWRFKNLFQLGTYFMLSTLFQWGVAFHELSAERVYFGKKREDRTSPLSDQELKRMFLTKAGRQVFKDYVFFPLICFPVWLPVLLGNVVANLIRNWWTATIIFCGHFTEGVHVFSEEDCHNESRGHWYYRQMLGSSNLTGPKWFHILTGHLSCQVEHHLFPDVPAWRYRAMVPKVKAIAARYGIPYNIGSFPAQYWTVLRRIARYSLPVADGQKVTRLPLIS